MTRGAKGTDVVPERSALARARTSLASVRTAVTSKRTAVTSKRTAGVPGAEGCPLEAAIGPLEDIAVRLGWTD